MDKQFEFLFKHVYAGKSIDDLAREYNPFEIFDKADIEYHLWARQICGKPSIKLAKELRKFREEFVDHKFGELYLKHFAKKTASISPEELKKYAIKLDVQLGVAHPEICQDNERDNSDRYFSYRFGDPFFYEGKFSFCLLYEGMLMAYLSFDTGDKKVVVKQIQGIKSDSKETTALQQIKFTLALLNYKCTWAKQQNIPEIEVVSVLNSPWAKRTFDYLKANGVYSHNMTLKDAINMNLADEQKLREKIKKDQKISESSIHLMPAQGFMIYDVSARRCGFKKNKEGNYSKILT